MAKIAAVLADQFEDIEFTRPKKAYEDAGHTVEVVGLEEGTVTGKHGEQVQVDVKVANADYGTYDALFIAGGFSPDILRADDEMVEFAKQFMDDMKPVFTICHGPQLLINTKTLDGRDITGYKSILVDLENAGAKLHDTSVFVCQNQLVSSRTPDDLDDFEKASVELLQEKGL